MKIGFDFDEVIVDTSGLFSVVAKELYGVSVPPEKFYAKKRQNSDLQVGDTPFLASQKSAYWRERPIKPRTSVRGRALSADFCDFGAAVSGHLLTAGQYDEVWERVFYSVRGLELQPMPGALEYLARLLLDHEAVIVTSRGSDSASIALDWLSARGLKIPVKCTCDGSKAPYCRGLDVFVDDNPAHLLELQSVVSIRFHFCQYGVSSRSGERVESWQELYERIVSLSSE